MKTTILYALMVLLVLTLAGIIAIPTIVSAESMVVLGSHSLWAREPFVPGYMSMSKGGR